MILFRVLLGIFACAFALVVWLGDRAERRYVNSQCQYRMIEQTPDAMGIVSVGGSQMLTAADADDLNAVLDKTGGTHAPAYNLAHSYFTLAKEYVLLRDLFEAGWRPRTVLVMLTSRNRRHGTVHPEFAEIARLSDIPISLRAIWAESPWAAIAGAAQILRHHLQIWEHVKLPKNAPDRVRNCHLGDYRLTLEHLQRGPELRALAAKRKVLPWDIAGPGEIFTRTYVEAIADLAAEHGAQAIFVNIPRVGTPLPAPEFPAQFLDATGVRFLTPPVEMARRLDAAGRRDISHMNAAGRAYFQPWLIEEIRSACTFDHGCL